MSRTKKILLGLVPALAALAAGGVLSAAQGTPIHYVRICKQAGPGVTGNFTFAIYDTATQTTKTVVVAAGSCLQSQDTAIAALSDPVVSEAPSAGTKVSSITASGGGSTVVWTDLANRSIKVTSPGEPWVVTVTFRNVKAPAGSDGTGGTATPHGATIKICKVAGPNVAVGTPFSFVVDGGPPLTVPAGPAPGGSCAILPGLTGVGDDVTIEELPVAGSHVTSIAVAPTADLVSADLPGAQAVVHTTPGVTEVTFTNARGVTGWMEICKKLDKPSPVATPPFLFTIPGTSVGTVSVPVGACSPAIEVPAGQVTVTELSTSNSALVGCATENLAQLITCNQTARTATVSVVAGDVSHETILTMTNRKL
jgi:hypothetical protein